MFHVGAVDSSGSQEYDTDCQTEQDARDLCDLLATHGGFFSTFITHPDGHVEQGHPGKSE